MTLLTARICHEVYLPQSAQPAAAQGLLAMKVSKLWQPGQEIRIKFLDGSRRLHKLVERLASEWLQYANLRFKFSRTAPDVRITFARGPSWSHIGTDCLQVPSSEPTMQLGWLDVEMPAAEAGQVVRHEFGHMLGAGHEHQSPRFDRVWDQRRVEQVFSGPPNNWSRRTIETNILNKFNEGMAATRYDAESIMLYMFPAEVFADGRGPTNTNTDLSALDISHISTMYPFGGV